MGYLFTSESVSEGHPDKVADQISDALLDEFLRWDPESKVACETFVTTGLVVCGGEVKTTGWVDVPGNRPPGDPRYRIYQSRIPLRFRFLRCDLNHP